MNSKTVKVKYAHKTSFCVFFCFVIASKIEACLTCTLWPAVARDVKWRARGRAKEGWALTVVTAIITSVCGICPLENSCGKR